jgi:hypothetical protein
MILNRPLPCIIICCGVREKVKASSRLRLLPRGVRACSCQVPFEGKYEILKEEGSDA